MYQYIYLIFFVFLILNVITSQNKAVEDKRKQYMISSRKC